MNARVIVYSLMASVLIGWWQRLLALVRLDQQSRQGRWVEPGNEVTRAILSGKVPSLPALAPATAVTFQYESVEEAPAIETAPALPPIADPVHAEEAVAVANAAGRAGRAA